MNLQQILQSVDLFEGLTVDELAKVAKVFEERKYKRDDLITRQGELGEEFFIISEGFVEVLLGEGAGSTNPSQSSRIVVSLGTGQIIGEMALLDQGPRSATIRAVSNPTVVQVVQRNDFDKLCLENNHIGYIVMRNLAADLSLKLRHRNLSIR